MVFTIGNEHPLNLQTCPPLRAHVLQPGAGNRGKRCAPWSGEGCEVCEGRGGWGEGGKGKGGKRGKIRSFISAMNERSVIKESAYFTVGEMYALAEDLQLGIADVDGFIESLNIAGELLKCGRMYKSASSELNDTAAGMSQPQRRRL